VVSVLEVVVLVAGLESLQVVSLLDVLPLVLNTGIGGVVALRWCVALVYSLGYSLLSVSQLLDEGFEVLFRLGGSQILDSRGDLVCMVVPENQVFRADFFSVFWC
jgi:hypothetical protein